MSYLLSVVIPTKNRYKYLIKLLRMLKKFPSDLVEVVVQDNSNENTEIIEFFNNEGKPDNFLYSYYKESIPIYLNSDYAILNSHGEYVCFIGDDDGVTAQILDVVSNLKEMNYESAISAITIYNWPDFCDTSIFNLTSTIVYKECSGHVTEINARDALIDVIKGGFRNLGKMPKVYQGIVRRDVLDKVYNKVDTYFPGGSPDMANATALATIVTKHCYIDLPVIISGQGRNVGGGERLNKGLQRPDQIAALPKDILETWNKHLPYYWCTQTIFPQSGMSALARMGFDYNRFINYENILSLFISKNPNYKNDALELTEKKKLVLFKYWCFYLNRIYFYFYNRLYYYFSCKRKSEGFFLKRNIDNIEMCVDFLMNETK